MNKSYDVYMCREPEKGLNLYRKENPIKVKPTHSFGYMGVMEKFDAKKVLDESRRRWERSLEINRIFGLYNK